jgi:hypothetical protein
LRDRPAFPGSLFHHDVVEHQAPVQRRHSSLLQPNLERLHRLHPGPGWQHCLRTRVHARPCRPAIGANVCRNNDTVVRVISNLEPP